MEIRIATLFLLLIIVFGCKENKNFFTIQVERNNTGYDTLFIHDLMTQEILAKVSLDATGTVHQFPIHESTLCEIAVRQSDKVYLTIVRPGAKKTVIVDSAFIKITNSTSDSLENYLWKSTNEAFSKYSNELFSKPNPDTIRRIFDNLISTRAARINEGQSKLSDEDYGFLQYRNKARVYSFLMFYGRIVGNYSPTAQFFNFIDSIETESPYIKSLPHTALYKYEIQYLRENDSIASLDSFLGYIENKTMSKDLEDFLKAFYLKVVIEQPSYWRKHEKLFYSGSISAALKRESDNKYVYLIDAASNSFFSSQKGVQGFDFVAKNSDGSIVNLSDYRGKLVLIDVWATWCGPCIAQRPAILALAQKYARHQDLVILMVSVDSSVDRWNRYVSHHNENGIGKELHIPDGMHTEFGNRYNIRSIPRYIFIDRHGVIINSNLMEPSIGMELLIESELNSPSLPIRSAFSFTF